MIARAFALFIGGAGAVFFSQAPEFSNHYQQRIGGAVDELSSVVDSFDQDAAQNELDRHSALQQMAGDEDRLIRDRAASMERTIDRLDQLELQQIELSQSPGVLKPFFVALSPDPLVVDGAWEDFAPAVPITIAGLVYTGLGFLLGLIIALPIAGLFRRLFYGKRSRNVSTPA